MADREWRTLRERQRELMRTLDRLDLAPQGAASELVKVFQQVTIPTTAGKFLACHPVTPGGTEVEGGAGSFSVATASTMFVLPVGLAVPVVGDMLVAKAIGGRWVTQGGAPACITKVIFQRPHCPGFHVNVTFNDTDAGGATVYSGLTDINGVISFTGATPGHHFDVVWSLGDQSGTTSGVLACSTTTINIADPTGWATNCPVEIPTLYVTDGFGTHQIWPTPECFHNGVSDWSCALVPAGTCGLPTFTTVYNRYFSGFGCVPGANAGGIAGSSDLLAGFNCQSTPISYSGTYPACGGAGPQHPLCGTTFNIHE